MLKRKTVAIPMVDGIEWNTLEHQGYGDTLKAIGVWEWGFLYKEISLSDEDFAKKPRKTEPHGYHLNTLY